MVRQLRAGGGRCRQGKIPNCYLARVAFRANPLDTPKAIDDLERATRQINGILESLQPPQNAPERHTFALIAEDDEESNLQLLHPEWVIWEPDEQELTSSLGRGRSGKE